MPQQHEITRVQRHPTLLNFLILLLFYLISSVLTLLNSGARPINREGYQPAFGLAIFQAAALAGLGPALALCILGVTIFMWSQVQRFFKNFQRSMDSGFATVVLIAIPWIGLLAISAVALVLGLKNRELVVPAEFYFVVYNLDLLNFCSLFAITLNILTFIIDLLIGFSIYQEYKSNIAQGLQSSRLFDASNIQNGMLFEVGGLGVVMFVLAITSITIINQPSSTPFDFVMSLTGLETFLIFGSQSELFRYYALSLRQLTSKRRERAERRQSSLTTSSNPKFGRGNESANELVAGVVRQPYEGQGTTATYELDDRDGKKGGVVRIEQETSVQVDVSMDEDDADSANRMRHYR
ncbi:hypothetical protein BDY24DRAFT_414606 [Mrakia frigida]|uniref:uncharacterized protein n=1 Tax=Mrakia frigida TaxID=29902 RepID=UPI003FCC1401